MKQLSLREIQLEELDLLKKTAQFFDENKIRYFLDSGTLLGAVRHKGFIPWDDDVDICVPRPDFDKFIRMVQDKKCDLDVTYCELKNSPFPFAKVINKSISLVTEHDVESDYLWIDIFPVDGLNDDEKELQKKMKKIRFYSILIAIRYRKYWIRKKHIIKDILKTMLYPFCLLISSPNTRIVKEAKKNQFQSSTLAGDLVWEGTTNTFMSRKDFEEYVDISFEGQKFKTIKNYKKYLKQLYGDYMQLPPENERVTHHFKAYKK